MAGRRRLHVLVLLLLLALAAAASASASAAATSGSRSTAAAAGAGARRRRTKGLLHERSGTISSSATILRKTPAVAIHCRRRIKGRGSAPTSSAIPLRKATTAAALPPTLRGGAKAEQQRRISIWMPILAAYLYNLSIGFTIPVLPKARP